jgi:hypothetical protein
VRFSRTGEAAGPAPSYERDVVGTLFPLASALSRRDAHRALRHGALRRSGPALAWCSIDESEGGVTFSLMPALVEDEKERGARRETAAN